MRRDAGYGARVDCWRFVVVSLGRPARHLFDFPFGGASEFRRDSAGRVALWAWEGGLMGQDRSMAGRIFAERVYRFTGDRLSDVTPSYCDAIFADSIRAPRRPGESALRRFAAAARATDSTYEIAADVEALILQNVFCRRCEAALNAARTMWPSADRERFLAEFRDAVISRFPEYGPPLRAWR